MVAIASRKPIYRKRPEDFLRKRKVRFISLKILKLFQLLTIFLILLFTVWSVWFDEENMFSNYVESKSKQLFLDAGFAIRKIEISGNEKVSNNDILNAMLKNELADISNYPILMLSLKQVQNNLSHIKWIKEISITKNLPGTVIVNITEREPAALWQRGDEIWVTDDKGNFITRDVEEYVHLPLIAAKDEKKDIEEVFDIMAASEALYDEVASFTRVGNRRWDVKLNNGVLVKLPEKHPVKAWRKLEELDKQKSILGKKVSYIDMRIEGQLVIGL